MFLPKVCIMMPAYNAQETICRALNSLKYQYFENWECIIVDDGSTDATSDLVKRMMSVDDRFNLISLEKNYGRGYARQIALEYCLDSDCEFIAMLDADDWYFPNKLNDQINSFLNNLDVDLISCKMAVIDRNDNIIGTRGNADNIISTFSKPGQVPLPHASTMFKKSIVGDQRYDISLKYGQDMDFLRRILLGRKYLILKNIGYVYEEGYSNNFAKSFLSYFYSAKSYLKFFRKFKFSVILNIFIETAKALRLFLFFIIGKYEKAIQKRSQTPETKEINEFKHFQKKLIEFK